MIATMEFPELGTQSPPAYPVPPHPCDACKRSKLKCDQRRPTCDTCQKREKVCEYSTADAYKDGRVRRFHRRSRNGCSHCKTRRVRCDEHKPVCGGCKRKGAEDLCIYPPDTGRSSRSKSPTSPTLTGARQVQATHVPATSGADAQVHALGAGTGTMPDQVYAPTSINPEYFTHPVLPMPSLDEPHFDLETNSNNAMSVWNPNIATPSPTSLFASLFGPQSIDTFQYQPQPQPQPQVQPQPNSFSDFSSNDLRKTFFQQRPPEIPPMTFASNTYHPQYDLPTSARYKDTFNWNGLSPKTLAARDGKGGGNGNGNGGLLEMDPFSLETTGSSESTPISLNSSNAFNSTFAFVQPEYRDRPEHPAYLYQLQLIEQPDLLTPFFPSLEQRHQFRHFFYQTSQSLLTTPTAHSSNPFLCHFSHLALGAPSGQSITHDAFRYALLSLASLDIGIKMNQAIPEMTDNAMYGISDEQRAESYKRLLACSISGILKDDPNDADLAIATVVALSIRDRLAGCQDWEPPLKIGQTVVLEAGGASAFINARPTADRRFLVEQLAILELIGYLTIWISPKILAWDNEWFCFYDTGEGSDHIQAVYGWTREAVIYSARTMVLCGEARDIDAMREAQPKPVYRQLKTIIEARMGALVKRVKDFIPQGDMIRQNTLMSPLPREVTVGVLGIQACMDLCLRTVILMDDIKAPVVQNLVASILDLADESIARAQYAGLLLPLSWADGVAQDPGLKLRAKVTLRSLKGRYHLNQDLLERIVNIDWASLNNIGLHDWEDFLRKNGYYVPCF